MLKTTENVSAPQEGEKWTMLGEWREAIDFSKLYLF